MTFYKQWSTKGHTDDLFAPPLKSQNYQKSKMLTVAEVLFEKGVA